MTSSADLSRIIDHTLLASDTTAERIDSFLESAVALGVARVCISPSVLPVNKRGLEIVTVVGFPSGAHKSSIKAAEAAQAILDGADEIDMVVNQGLVKAADWDAVEAEIAAVRAAVPVGNILKVIIESANLTDAEIVHTAQAAAAAGADQVKTSTGYHPAGGASVHAVSLMAKTVAPELGVKASGAIRSAQAVRDLLAAGATRFGVSGTAAILAEWDGADVEPPSTDAY
ncbi:deoxyribose-phosphate aldolase [Klugiella xanthotipulae]|uniref:Deoxyribose-phosphate aldolase n=1 Tax=Klugiella xanthotipulae TaxID=244735 RepID=A0A543HXN2_9MICO|nr:deoxyribose-phosphate aldolase [Klugiella xanthotipulae]TQM63114.1 deoxyribose-phosphate aldolase [Klugiella xanthotipulae]